MKGLRAFHAANANATELSGASNLLPVMTDEDLFRRSVLPLLCIRRPPGPPPAHCIECSSRCRQRRRSYHTAGSLERSQSQASRIDWRQGPFFQQMHNQLCGVFVSTADRQLLRSKQHNVQCIPQFNEPSSNFFVGFQLIPSRSAASLEVRACPQLPAECKIGTMAFVSAVRSVLSRANVLRPSKSAIQSAFRVCRAAFCTFPQF